MGKCKSLDESAWKLPLKVSSVCLAGSQRCLLNERTSECTYGEMDRSVSQGKEKRASAESCWLLLELGGPQSVQLLKVSRLLNRGIY